MTLTPFDSVCLGSNSRACVRHLESVGIQVSFHQRSASAESAAMFALPEKERWIALSAETILTGLRACGWCEWKLAARCWAQAAEYRGRAGGFLPASLSDAFGSLRNSVERALLSDGQDLPPYGATREGSSEQASA